MVPCLGLIACAGRDAVPPPCPPRFEATAWEAADLLFRRDSFWVGGDGAYSVDLGTGQVLWLFGDSWIDPVGRHSRQSPSAEMVSNTLAIQKGYDPATASMRFFWRSNADEVPTAFFPDESEARYWPGDGILLRDRLLLFLMKVRSVPTGLGFEVYDWEAVLVRNPEADPTEWDMTWLETPVNNLQVIVGSASVLVEDGFVYAYSSREPSGGDVYLVRWPEPEAYAGNLAGIEWWAGDAGWIIADSGSFDPQPVLRGGGTEFTVHRHGRDACFLQVQSVGFGPAVLTMRSAAFLTGPWGGADTLYRPPEFDRAGIMIYQGKAHPQLSGADIVLTYSTNHFHFQSQIEDSMIYYPRFVRLTETR